ncbi:MAG: flagellar export chaperone FliS [Magnetococcales bacterium]|nr:flagellar export chaperone FliS [Magnetococcales bacterium]
METPTQSVPPPPVNEENLSQLDVLVQLYEGSIQFLEQAARACEDGRVAEFKHWMQRGRRIIEEFQRTLDFSQGGQVPAQLNDLYSYMLDSLTQAGLTHESEFIYRVIEQLRILLDGWRGLQAPAVAVSMDH